jgi:hypothetical protein
MALREGAKRRFSAQMQGGFGITGTTAIVQMQSFDDTPLF